jgi:tRNA(Ile2) C34 agmatinyltransferase TiaS
MGLFSNPKCPVCGIRTVPTGYSFPFPQWRCNNCYSRNKKQKEYDLKLQSMQAQIDELKNKQ